MNKTEIEGNWKVQKGKLMKRYALLTDNDLMFEEGKKEEMLGNLHRKLGQTKEEFQKMLAGL